MEKIELGKSRTKISIKNELKREYKKEDRMKREYWDDYYKREERDYDKRRKIKKEYWNDYDRERMRGHYSPMNNQ